MSWDSFVSPVNRYDLSHLGCLKGYTIVYNAPDQCLPLVCTVPCAVGWVLFFNFECFTFALSFLLHFYY